MTDPEYVPERRPITSREHPLSIRIASRMAGAGVSPNAISVAGMIAGILAGLVFALTTLPGYGWILFFAVAALMQLRLLANMLDGIENRLPFMHADGIAKNAAEQAYVVA